MFYSNTYIYIYIYIYIPLTPHIAKQFGFLSVWPFVTHCLLLVCVSVFSFRYIHRLVPVFKASSDHNAVSTILVFHNA